MRRILDFLLVFLLTISISCIPGTAAAQQPIYRSLTFNNGSSSLYNWEQTTTWSSGLIANSSSDFVLLGDGTNNFSSQFLWLPDWNYSGGINRTIGGFDGSAATSAGLFLTGTSSGNAILNLAPDQAYQSVLGSGKEIYINGNAVDVATTLNSTAELRGNANASLLNQGTILSSSGYLGVIRSLNLENAASGTIRKVGLTQSSIINSGKIIDSSMLGVSVTQTPQGEIQAENYGSWIRGNSSINGGIINARSSNISIWDSNVANAVLKGNVVGFVNGSVTDATSQANQLIISFNSSQGIGTTVASGTISFDRIDISHTTGQGTGQLQMNGATLKNRVSQGYVYNQGKIFGTGTFENLQVFQASTSNGPKQIEAQNGALQLKSTSIYDQSLSTSGSGFFEVVQGSNFIHRGSVQSGSRLEVRSGASLSLNDLQFNGELRNQGFGVWGVSGADITGVIGSGLFVNQVGSGMRFLGNNSGLRVDNYGSVGVFQSLTVSELINRSNADLIINNNANLVATTVSNHGVLIINGNSTLQATSLDNYAGAWILGTGNLNANVNINQGSILSPGNSPGILSTGSQAWNSGGKLILELNNATGVAGINWDLLSLTGSLNVNATTQNPFLIDITSLNLTNQIAAAANFNSSQSYSWRFLTAQGGLNGFSAPKFSLLNNNFLNPLDGGSFWVSQDGNSLYLNFSPVPEPTAMTLCGLVWLLSLCGTQRRRPKHV